MSARAPRPREEILLSIGGLVAHIELSGAQPVFMEQLRARYGAFEMPAAPWVERDISLRLTVESATPPGDPGRRAHIDAHPLAVNASARTIAAERWDFSVKLTAESGRAARTSYRGSGRCEMNPFALDCMLRVLFSTVLPRLGGMLIHGCGLRNAEVGVVFPGRSGAGKTTLARKTPDPDDVLSDELVVVRRSDDGTWRVHGTPFWGDFARGGISMRSWPLRTVAFLAQAPRDAVTMTPIVSSDATLRLLGCFLSFATDRATVERNLAIAVQLCAEVRSVEASLTKNVPTAEIFRKLAPHLGPEVTRKAPPQSAREMISEFRSFLRKHKSYAFKPKGSSMRPWLKTGDSLFIQAAPETELAAGDILLYWSPGATPDEDALTCHRMVARVPGARGNAPRFMTKGDAMSRIESFENRRECEILGKVAAISRDGKTWPVPGRIGNLARLFGSLVAIPILRMAGR
ncbi:MAG TPA: hypothetical protein VN903_31315 [Polyangia bacterium]|jgi:hypothetical protein|nr:hypothetical protein [Polyangia bacterium]